MGAQVITAVGALGHPIQALKPDQHIGNINVSNASTPVQFPPFKGTRVVMLSSDNNDYFLRINRAGNAVAASANNAQFIPRRMINYFTISSGDTLALIRSGNNDVMVSISLCHNVED